MSSTQVIPLRITPGEYVTHNLEIHGSYVVVATEPDITTSLRQGIVIPYSLIQDSVLAISTLTLPLNTLSQYFSDIIIPEVYNSNITLRDPVLIALTIIDSSSLQLLITNIESEFYIPQHTAIALRAWRSLATTKSLRPVLSPLIALMDLHFNTPPHSESITLNLEDDIEKVPNQETGELEDERTPNREIFELAKQHVYSINVPVEPAEQRILDNVYECYEIVKELTPPNSSNDADDLGIIIINDHKYVSLIHEPELIKFWPRSLEYLCSLETSDAVNLKSITDDEPYLFSVGNLTNQNTLGEIGAGKNSNFIRPLDEGLRALDYYAGFPISELDITNNYIRITGECIAACFCNYRDYTAEQVIDLLYPETVLTPYDQNDALIDFKTYSIDIPDLDHIIIETLEGEELSSFNLDLYEKDGDTIGGIEIEVTDGTPLDIIVDVQTTDEFVSIVENALEVIQKYYPTAFNESEIDYQAIIAGAHRTIVFTIGNNLSILRDPVSMTRGWVSYKDDKDLDCTLSATCLYSFINKTSYNYFFKSSDEISDILIDWVSKRFEVKDWIYDIVNAIYRHSNNLYDVRHDDLSSESNNILYALGRKDLMKLLFHYKFSSAISEEGEENRII